MIMLAGIPAFDVVAVGQRGDDGETTRYSVERRLNTMLEATKIVQPGLENFTARSRMSGRRASLGTHQS
jgi:hypothetical protein